MVRFIYGGALLLCAVFPGYAQQPSPPPPTSGDVLRDLEDKRQALPPKAPPAIDVAPGTRRAVKPLPGFKIDVKGFRFTGLTTARAEPLQSVMQKFGGLPAVQEERLQALVQKYIGPDRTFSDLQAAADAVTAYLQQQGYFVAQAFLPEQKVADGIVEITILEGRLGTVRVDIDERARISRDMVDGLLSALTPGMVLHQDTVERALFLLSDLRGITVRSVIEPGSEAGTANLVVKVEAGRLVDGTIEFDNHGSRFTGQHRLGASINLNSPLKRGDVLSFRGLLAVPGGDEDTKFGRLSYLTPVGRYGTKIGAAYLKLRYHLGTDIFTALDQRGESEVGSVFALHPFVRGRTLNLFGQANYDVRKFHDDRRAVATVSDRRIRAGAFALVGDSRDRWLGGGFNNFSLAYTRGSLDLRTAADLAADQGAAGHMTDGHYSKLNGSISRSNTIGDTTSLYLSFAFQRASKNLDGSEKLSLGGPSAVRAYAVGEGTSDEGQLYTAEIRQGLPRTFIPGNLIASVFYDYGHGKVNRNPLAAEVPINTRNLSGAGVGLSWGRLDDFFLRGTAAWRLSDAPVSDPRDRKPRVYFQLVKYL